MEKLYDQTEETPVPDQGQLSLDNNQVDWVDEVELRMNGGHCGRIS